MSKITQHITHLQNRLSVANARRLTWSLKDRAAVSALCIALQEETGCGRCGKPVTPDTSESCWFCLGDLCVECWDRFGHCGHPGADETNDLIRAGLEYENEIYHQ